MWIEKLNFGIIMTGAVIGIVWGMYELGRLVILWGIGG